MTRRRPASEAGYTLSEVLIATVILAVSITAIVGSIGSSVFSTRVHRDIVTSDTVVRAYAEQLTQSTYVDCTAGSGTAPTYPAMTGLPAGFTATVTAVTFWNGSTSNPAVFQGTCPATGDQGLQLLTVRAQRGTGVGVQTLQFVKRKLP